MAKAPKVALVFSFNCLELVWNVGESYGCLQIFVGCVAPEYLWEINFSSV